MPSSLPPLPSADEIHRRCLRVIDTWHEREHLVDGWESAEQQVPGPDDDLVHRLALINTFQWHEEDRSRDLGASVQILAQVKRSIDASNRRRVQTIDALDHWYVSALEAAGAIAATAPLPSESVASIVDRLTILALKIYHVREACDAASEADRAAMAARQAILEEQRDDLGACLDRLQADVLAGRLRLKLYRQVKVYRDAATGRLRADVS